MSNNYTPKHENPLGWGFEEFSLSDMSREELADRLISAKEDMARQKRLYGRQSIVDLSKDLRHEQDIRGIKRKFEYYIAIAFFVGLILGILSVAP
jgi:hypothetical protein